MFVAGERSEASGVKYHFSIDNDWTPSQTKTSQPIKMKLTTSMLTPAGFTTVHKVGTGHIGAVPKAKSQGKKYYLALSGGGWRALSAHMGTFRVLGDTGALSMVNFLSSVSGGSWFLSKFAFDEDFAQKVLSDDIPIADVSMEWFENSYFPEMQHVDQPQETISKESALKSSVSKIISKAAGPIKQSLGTVILAADRFGLSWQEVVESSVLGKHIASRTLETAKVTPRAKLGKQFTLSMNWNQLPLWEDKNSQWFVKMKRKGQRGEHVQHPLYTSALYTQFKNGTNKVEVRAQGKLMTKLLTVCHQKKVNAHTGNTSTEKFGTTWYATLVKSVMTMLDIISKLAIAGSVSWIKKYVCFSMAALQQDSSAIVWIAVIASPAIIAYTGHVQVDQILTQSKLAILIAAIAAVVCWVAAAFILYARHQPNHDVACSDKIRYLFIATFAVPVQAASAVVGAALAAGPEAAGATFVAVLGVHVWMMSEQDVDPLNKKMLIIVFVVAAIYIFENIIIVVTAEARWLVKTLVLVAVCASYGTTIWFALYQRRDGRIQSVLAYIASILLISLACIPVYVVITADVRQPVQLLVLVFVMYIVWVLAQICARDVQRVRFDVILWALAVYVCVILFVFRCIPGSLMKTLPAGIISVFCVAYCKDAKLSLHLMAIYLLVWQTILDVTDVLIFSKIKTIAVAVTAVLVTTTFKRKSDWRFAVAVFNIVVCIVEISALAAAMWVHHAEQHEDHDCGAFSFDFKGLTIGQVVSASSAAAGAGSARLWVQNILEFARAKVDEMMGGLHCQVSPTVVDKLFNQKSIKDECLSLLGCTDEHSGETASKWSGWLRGMAVKMKLKNSAGESRMGHMAIDAVRPNHSLHVVHGSGSYAFYTSHVLTQRSPLPAMNQHHWSLVQGYNDNSGLGPIVGNYLDSTSDEAQVLVLVMNQLGDNQMETYFKNPSGNNNGGLMCEDENTDPKMYEVFRKVDAIYNQSFKAIGGEYVQPVDERTCVIRVPRTLFFAVRTVNTYRRNLVVGSAEHYSYPYNLLCRSIPLSTIASKIPAYRITSHMPTQETQRLSETTISTSGQTAKPKPLTSCF